MMESKTDLLNLLFQRWEQSVNDYKGKFVSDGIIDESLYTSSSPKILFITKEPNNPHQEEGSYSQWWNEGLKYGFSNRIAEWSYGLINNFPLFDTIDEASKCDAIRHIAVMNIKKIGGSATSVYKEIESHVKNDLKFILEQIHIIEPDIIVLCISWWQLLRDMIFPNTNWYESGYNLIPIGRYGNIKIIDFYHPSCRKPSVFTYDLLQKITSSDGFKSL